MQGFNYSFSGIKTAVLYFLQNNSQKDSNFVSDNLDDICASVQHRLIMTLLQKLKKASKHTGINEIAIAGGVSANSYLRKMLAETGEELNWKTYIPKFEFCTDNAGMIAMTAHFKYQNKEFLGMDAAPKPRMKFSIDKNS
jgi:N6-L-threonylcarbamoyladenine synthase